MNPNTFPTKGNLILAKNSLVLSKQGYELMDKKRNILIRELMNLISQAEEIQSEIDKTFSDAVIIADKIVFVSFIIIDSNSLFYFRGYYLI